MPKTGNIKWIPLLMATSQVLLTGFVAYWLAGQYRNEKELLREEIGRMYTDSHSQVMDSLLFNRVVEPALKDTFTVKITGNPLRDTLYTVTGKPAIARFNTHPSPDSVNTVVAVTLPDSGNARQLRERGMFAMKARKQDILIRSVRLIMTQTEGKGAATSHAEWVLPDHPDTGLFKKVFRERVSKKYTGLKINWLSDTTPIREKSVKPAGLKKVSLRFANPFPDNFPEASISGEFPVLFRSILPQILFGLILLILTGSAFLVTNRNLRRQLLLNNIRNDFVSNITHELKTPVSTVRVALEALKTYDKVRNPQIAGEYIDMARQEVDRLDRMIGKILDQSLIGEQNRLVRLEPVNLFQLTREVLNSLQPRLDERGASVVLDDPGNLRPVDADPLYVQGVLFNLLDNSLKYVPGQPDIRIRLYEQKGGTCIDVADNGPGIPKEYLDRVFDKFFRVPAGDTHTIKGYGLGLSFAALVMRQHGGSISVRNGSAGGCIFTLTFPQQHS